MDLTCHTDHAHIRPAVFLVAAAFFFFLSGSMTPFAHAEQPESGTPFSTTLQTPPALVTDGTADEQPDCTVPANARTHPMICSANAGKDQTRSASAKEGYLDNADVLYTPRLGNISQKMDKALSGSQKEEYDWEVGVELRGSPVKEEHGDADRHDSLGGLIKGNLRF